MASGVKWLRGKTGIAKLSLRGATGTTTATNCAILVGAALAGIVTARALGPAGRGQLAIASLWPTLIQVIGSLGLQSSCSYHFALWPSRRTALVRWIRLKIVFQTLAMTVVSGIALWILRLHLRLDPLLVIEYSTWAAATTISLYGACCAQGSNDFARFNRIRLVSGAAPAVLILACAATLRLTTAEAGAAYVIPTWCSAFLASRWLRGARNNASVEPLSTHERRSVISYGWRSVASLSGLTLNQNADQLTLGLLVPSSSLGIYSAAVSAPNLLPSLVASIGMVGLPAVAAKTGEAKRAATRRAMVHATWSVVIISPVLAILLPWAIPFVYGARYSAAVIPAEILLVGAVFSALTVVADNLLRAYGYPGFVSVSQGVGGTITGVGTLLLDGHPLSAVSAVSTLGFILAFALALVRLRAAVRYPPGRHSGEYGRQHPQTEVTGDHGRADSDGLHTMPGA
jgi:O-antigen/teichoic acid export membrane protein